MSDELPNVIFTLYVDDCIFRLTRKTIEMYPNTLLINIINEKTTVDRIIKDGTDLYIDRDPKSFAYVVDYLRNYDVNLDDIKDEYFRRKVVDDLDYFDLYCNYNSLDCEVKLIDIPNDEKKSDIVTDIFAIQTEPLLDEGSISLEAMNDISTNPLFRAEHKQFDESSTESIEFGEDDHISEHGSDNDSGYEII